MIMRTQCLLGGFAINVIRHGIKQMVKGQMPELAEWLLDQIETTTELARMDYIAECIAFDKGIDAAYLADARVVSILRRAWAAKRDELSG